MGAIVMGAHTGVTEREGGGKGGVEYVLLMGWASVMLDGV